MTHTTCHTLILGAGAAGLMAAAHAGPDTLVLDHAAKPGEKIRISGGGRCNFTNLHCAPEAYLSENPHFMKSALARYTQWDFIDLVDRHGITWHEKTLGQLFCDGKATQITDMLLREAKAAGAEVWLNTSVEAVRHTHARFDVRVLRNGAPGTITARNLVLATGGKSIPKMGATGLAYEVARQFGHRVTETRPALVPLTFDKGRFAALAGVAVPVRVVSGATTFDEAMLFTHRGVSGPAVLQVSSYWREGTAITVDLLPGADIASDLRDRRTREGKRQVATVLAHHLPAKLAQFLAETQDWRGKVADLSDKRIDAIAAGVHGWSLKPTGSEGYRTAEVTLGGIATDGLDSQSMMSKHVPGLYAIGEAVDVTGWLGGYNFQWAWSSAVAAGRDIVATRQM